MEKKKIAFVCVHNSCRSQIAEALGNHLRGNGGEFVTFLGPSGCGKTTAVFSPNVH